MSSIRRILLPTDFSTRSAAAHEHAVDMAKAHGAEICIVHVLGPTAATAPVPGRLSGPRAHSSEDAERTVQAALDYLVTSTEKAGARGTSLLLKGELYDQVIAAARSSKADILVMGVTLPMNTAELRWPDLANQLAKEPIRVALVSTPLMHPNPDFLLPLNLQVALPGTTTIPAAPAKPKPSKRKPKPKPN